jgi:hypothetical protein
MDVCCICLCPYNKNDKHNDNNDNNETITELRCGHILHTRCYHEMIEKMFDGIHDLKCPLCKHLQMRGQATLKGSAEFVRMRFVVLFSLTVTGVLWFVVLVHYCSQQTIEYSEENKSYKYTHSTW